MRPRAEARVVIHAPLDLVWRVMLDTDAYPVWNPFIVRVDGIEGVPREGQLMRLHVRWSDGGSVVSPEQIVTVSAPSAGPDGTLRATLAYGFRGPLHALRLVRGTRLQVLEQPSGGPTLYRTEEAFTGMFARAVPVAKVRDGFARHAQALKTYAESLAARDT
jgi:hypothetical protein